MGKYHCVASVSIFFPSIIPYLPVGFPFLGAFFSSFFFFREKGEERRERERERETKDKKSKEEILREQVDLWGVRYRCRA